MINDDVDDDGMYDAISGFKVFILYLRNRSAPAVNCRVIINI